jgi:hypothetical protein
MPHSEPFRISNTLMLLRSSVESTVSLILVTHSRVTHSQRGNIARVPMPEHRGADIGIHSRGYNARWAAEIARRGGPRNLSSEDVLEIDSQIRAEYGLPPR